MENFNLKKFLTENKLTTASKLTEGEKVDLTQGPPKLKKSLKELGEAMFNRLKGQAIEPKLVMGALRLPPEANDAIAKNEKLAGVTYAEDSGSSRKILSITVNKAKKDVLQKTVNEFDIPKENGGTVEQVGNDLAKVEIFEPLD